MGVDDWSEPTIKNLGGPTLSSKGCKKIWVDEKQSIALLSNRLPYQAIDWLLGRKENPINRRTVYQKHRSALLLYVSLLFWELFSQPSHQSISQRGNWLLLIYSYLLISFGAKSGTSEVLYCWLKSVINSHISKLTNWSINVYSTIKR